MVQKNRPPYTMEELKQEAAPFTKRSDFQKNSKAYWVAHKRGVLDEVCAHMQIPQNAKWTDEELRMEANPHTSRSAFQQANPGAYKAAHKRGILDDICSHMPKNVLSTKAPHNKKWTLETLQVEYKKHKNRYQLKKNNPSAFNAAKKMGILDDLYPEKGAFRNEPYTFEEVKEKVKQYDTKTQLKEAEPYLYRFINKNNNYKEVLPEHVIHEPWEEDDIKAVAKNHDNRMDFKHLEVSAYNSAKRKGLLEEVCAHMKKSQNISTPEEILFKAIKNLFPKTQVLKDRKVKIENRPYIHGFDIDIYIPELRKGVEFDGKYWHTPKGLSRGRPNWPEEDLENYHQIKDEYFLSKGIQILHIDEKDWLKNKEECIQKAFAFLGI